VDVPAGPPREPVADQPGLERDAWTQLDLPAICERAHAVAIGPGEVLHRAVGDVLHPEREPLVELERLRATMGSQALAAQYQQAPVPAEGTMIRRAWLRRYGVPPVRRPDDLIVQSWDTASKPEEIHDFSVCTTWMVRGRQCYLLEVFRERLAYPELRRAVLRLSREHDASAVLIEDTGSGIHLIQDLARSGELFPIACTPAGDKVMRLHAQSVRFEAGEVLLPERAPWLDDDFLDELLAFPGGRYDDQVDALTQALVSGDTTN
jgi:predicted phage terminase large subunit-like protein